MNFRPDVDDLVLVVAVARTGSLGAAAREVGVSQPSASQRLGRLERRLGVVLFERDTRGARATAAGREMTRQAEHVLGHLDQVGEAVRSAAAEPSLVVGTFASLAASLFPVLDEVLDHRGLVPRVDHGDVMTAWVGEGTMDAAFMAIADQVVLPQGVRVHPVGDDVLVVLVPAGVEMPTTRRQPLRGLAVPYCTYDLGTQSLHERLAAAGAVPRRAASLDAALAMARRAGHPAVVPRSAVADGLRPGERTVTLPFTHRLRLSMVTGPRPDPRLVACLPRLRDELGLV